MGQYFRYHFLMAGSPTLSVMNVNGHADEHGRQQREYVRLDQDHDDFEARDQGGEGNREDEADADARDGAPGHLREDEDEREQREDRDVSSGHVGGESHGERE